MFACSWHVCAKERACMCGCVAIFVFLPNQCLIRWLIVIERVCVSLHGSCVLASVADLHSLVLIKFTIIRCFCPLNCDRNAIY